MLRLRPLLPSLIQLFNIAEDLSPARSLNRTRHKGLRNKLPVFLHLLLKMLDILCSNALYTFVGLGEDKRKRHFPLAKLIQEFKVLGLGLVPAVNQYKDGYQVLTRGEVSGDHLLPGSPLALGTLGIAVSRKIDEVPFSWLCSFRVHIVRNTLNIKMVNELRLPGTRAHFGELGAAGDQVDQR